MNKITLYGIEFTEPDFIDCANFRAKTSLAVKQGILIKQHCEICGNENSIAHHEVYSDFMNVRWLCRKHHIEIHNKFRKLNKNAYNKECWQNNKLLHSECRMDIAKVLEESGENINFPKLAKEMSDAGLFKNPKSAYDMIRFNNSGKAKSLDFALLEYLCKRFNRKVENIIQW
jgi:hypothetical protein